MQEMKLNLTDVLRTAKELKKDGSVKEEMKIILQYALNPLLKVQSL